MYNLLVSTFDLFWKLSKRKIICRQGIAKLRENLDICDERNVIHDWTIVNRMEKHSQPWNITKQSGDDQIREFVDLVGSIKAGSDFKLSQNFM